MAPGKKFIQRLTSSPDKKNFDHLKISQQQTTKEGVMKRL